MATTDVAGLVTPVYTPTLPVTTDTSILTQADLTNTVVSLANRIEFLRDLVDVAADTPEASCVLREEFWGAIWTSGESRLDADNVWRTAFLGSPAVSGLSSSSNSPGELVIALPEGAEFRFQIGLPTDDPFGFLTMQHLTMRLKIDDDPVNTNTIARLGLCQDASLLNGGTNSLAVLYQKGLDASNWLLQVRKSGSTTFHVLAPFSDDDYFTCRFVKVGTSMEVRDVDNVVLHTVLAADMPGGSCTLGGYFISSAGADPNLATHSVDFIFARGKPPRI